MPGLPTHLVKELNVDTVTATWTSPQEGSSLFINEISEAESAKSNKIRSLDPRQYREKYRYDIVSVRKY